MRDRATAALRPSTLLPAKIMVCMSSRGPSTDRLLRFASHLAGRLNHDWYAVYVRTPAEAAAVIDSATLVQLSDVLTLAKQLGAKVVTLEGKDVADTILRFAHEKHVRQVVIGRPRPVSWWQRLMGEKSIAEELIHRSEGVTVVVIDAEIGEQALGW